MIEIIPSIIAFCMKGASSTPAARQTADNTRASYKASKKAGLAAFKLKMKKRTQQKKSK